MRLGGKNPARRLERRVAILLEGIWLMHQEPCSKRLSVAHTSILAVSFASPEC